MTKALLIKFLNDQCTGEELQEVIEWIKKDAHDHNSRGWGYQHWEVYTEGDELPENERFDSLLDKIHHKINTTSIDNQKNTGLTLRTLTIWLTRAAAILLIPVLAMLIFTLSRQSPKHPQIADFSVDSLEISAPIGSQTTVKLSDGSEVFLNHGSKLQYPSRFSGHSREVTLTGEGYFNVKSHAEKPFIVKTRNLNIKALGTEFNVFAYPGMKTISTTLVEGKVTLEEKINAPEVKPLGSMVPHQHVDYNTETGKITSTKGDIEKYISWKDGKLIFKNESIVQIASRLNRWYNVEIEFADEAAKEYTYTATFMDETLWQILDMLKMATPITWEKIPRKQRSDGTFSKQKIIIKKK